MLTRRQRNTRYYILQCNFFLSLSMPAHIFSKTIFHLSLLKMAKKQDEQKKTLFSRKKNVDRIEIWGSNSIPGNFFCVSKKLVAHTHSHTSRQQENKIRTPISFITLVNNKINEQKMCFLFSFSFVIHFLIHSRDWDEKEFIRLFHSQLAFVRNTHTPSCTKHGRHHGISSFQPCS